MIDLIEQSNKCFGPTLLGTFVFLSIWFVNGSFYIMVNLSEYGLDMNVIPFFLVEVFALFLFFLMIYASHRIHNEVRYLSFKKDHTEVRLQVIIISYWSKGLHFASRLRKYNPEEKETRQLAQHMVLEVLTSPLQLTAWGLFDINFHLLPSVSFFSINRFLCVLVKINFMILLSLPVAASPIS